MSVLALGATAALASASGVFETEQCVELVSESARIVAVIPPGSSDNNDATAFPVDTLPAIASGDLVRVKPAQGEAAPLPTFTVVEHRSDRCAKFWPSHDAAPSAGTATGRAGTERSSASAGRDGSRSADAHRRAAADAPVRR